MVARDAGAHAVREQHQTGIGYLEAATALLQRVRGAHRTAGLLEAADPQWWWRSPRSTDGLPQLFWFDHLDRPAAAVVATDWGDGIALDPIVMPNATPEWVDHVVGRGIDHAEELGLGSFDVVADRADHVMRHALAGHGFATEHDGMLTVECAWLAAGARPPVTSIHERYRLCSRLDTMHRPHHLIGRNGPELETRLRQASLYRPELDLLVLDDHEGVAAYGLFWYDPASATGLVEPMRTEVAHHRRGLARHLLSAGIELLAEAGAERIKVCFDRTNVAARALYLGVGFQVGGQTVVLSRPE